MRKTLLAERNALVAEVVREEIAAYLTGERWREDPVTGRKFRARSVNHFFASKASRREWYRGHWRPRRIK